MRMIASTGGDGPAGDSEAARLVRDHDWARTPLGAIDGWSPVLRAAVEMVLAHGFPSVLLWGPDLIQIYNDGYRIVMGDKHPAGLGQPTRECWPEVWHINQPIYERVLAGETLTFEDKLFPIARHGPLEDAWFTLTCSPVREDGKVAGVLVTVFETTRAHVDAARRDRAEAELRESEGRLRALAQASSDVIYRMSPDWTEMRQLYGRGFLADATAPTVRWWDEYIFPEDRAHIGSVIAEAIRTRSTFELEHRVQRVDGTPGWTSSRAVPVLGADGEIAEWFGTAADVTARRQAEAALRTSEEHQAFLLKLSDALRPLGNPVAVQEVAAWMLGTELAVDRCYYAEFDWPRDVLYINQEYVGSASFSVVGEHPISSFKALLDLSHRGEPLVCDNIAMHPIFSSEIAAYRERGTDGFILVPLVKQGGMAACMCVTMATPRTWSSAEIGLVEEVAERTWAAVERARAESALRDSEARLRALVENLPGGAAFIVDSSLRYVLAGGEALEASGVRAEDLVGRTIFEALPPELATAYEPYYRHTSAGEPFEVEHAAHGRSFISRGAPLRSHDGNDRSVLVVSYDITDRKTAEAALRTSEEKYRTLFETMGQGYCDLELLRDASGRAVDQLYLEFNPAFERLIGIPVAEAKGRRASEVLPELEPWWHEAFDRIAQHGEPERIEYEVTSLGRWFEVYAYPRGGDRLTVLYEDVTERRRAEDALRTSEQRQAFLLELSDALRPLIDAEEIQLAAATVLGRRLGACRVAYGENAEDDRSFVVSPNYVDGASDMSGRFRYADWGADLLFQLRSGQNRIQPDLRNDERLSERGRRAFAEAGIGASLNVPLVKGGRLVAFLGVNYATAHDFEPQEIELIEDVAERTWAAVERARAEAALRDSEERYRRLFESMDEGFLLVDVLFDDSGKAVDIAYLEANPAAHSLTGKPELVGLRMSDVEPGFDPAWAEVYGQVALSGQSLRTEFFAPQRVGSGESHIDRWFDFHMSRVGGADSRRVAVVFQNITARKRAEMALRESEDRQAFLLNLSDALRPLTDPVAIQGVACRVAGEHLNADRTYYGQIDLAREVFLVERDYVRGGAPSLVGEYAFAEFGLPLDILRAGDPMVVEDVATSPLIRDGNRAAFEAIALRSFLVVPLNKNGELAAGLAATSTTPRTWSTEEASLLTAVAERTWDAVERARAEAALRTSEERLRQFGEASQDVLWIRDAETLQWVYLTPAFEAIYGLGRDEALSGDNYRNWLDLIVPDDRERAQASMWRARAGEHVTFDYRIRRPSDGAIRWLRNTDFPILDGAGQVTLIGGVGHDATALRQTELRFQTLMEGVPQLVWRAIAGGKWTWASPQWTEYTGLSLEASVGWGWLEGLHPDDHAGARRFWEEAVRSGQLEMEVRLRSAGSHAYRWFQTRATPVRDGSGTIIEWLGTSTDIHELRELQERQHVLVAELQHRTRNLMGVVRSTADKTARASADLPDFRARFRDRLEALSRVQGLLSRLNEHDRVTFDDLIRSELSAMDGSAERVTLEGPDGVRLRSSTVQMLAMALHELATNAVKYGALGQSSGRLAIRWSLEARGAGETPWLHIDWRESGVEMPSPDAEPGGTGQGRELIEKALPYQLSARTTYRLGPDGVHCTISVPVSASTKEANHG